MIPTSQLKTMLREDTENVQSPQYNIWFSNGLAQHDLITNWLFHFNLHSVSKSEWVILYLSAFFFGQLAIKSYDVS